MSLALLLNFGCFFAANRKCLDFLFQAAASAILSWCKEQGFLPGLCAVGHTFGGVLNFHPHIHILLSDGGLADDLNFDFLTWKDCSFFPEKVLKARFKYVLIKSLRFWIKEKVREKAFSIPRSVLNLWYKKYSVRDFFSLSQKLYKVIWYVYIGEKLNNASFTARYIGRYAKRPAISETKIIFYSLEKQIVRFRHKDKISGSEKMETVSVEEFIKRLIRHIPEKHFRMIRYYGFYANRVKNSLLELICYQLLILFGQAQVLYRPDEQPQTWRQRILLSAGSDPLLCPICQVEMELAEIAFRSRDGPFWFNYWTTYKVPESPNQNRSCRAGQFENTIYYGLAPQTNYAFSFNLTDDFGQETTATLAFKTGDFGDYTRYFFHLQKIYNITSPEKTTLTYAVKNIEYLNADICEVEPLEMLNMLKKKLLFSDKPETLNCKTHTPVYIELPKLYWVKNYFKFNFKDYIKNPQGHYVISFSNPNYTWQEWKWDPKMQKSVQQQKEQIFERTYLTVTNLAVAEKMVKLGSDDIYLQKTQTALGSSNALYWVTEIGTLNPVKGARVDLYGKNLARAESFITGADGIAMAKPVVDFESAIITNGSDSTIISSQEDKFNWAKYANTAEKTYVYTDRPIYRPGHEVFIKGLNRIGYDGDYEIFTEKKADIKIFNSKHEIALEKALDISNYGTFETSFLLDLEAPLGMYRIEAPGGYGYFNVEEFVPAAFKVDMESDKDEYFAGETLGLSVQADYYFGVPLEGGTADYTILAQNYYFDRYKDEYFQFGKPWYYDYGQKYGDTFLLRGKALVDSNGKAKISQKLDFDELFDDENNESKLFVVNVSVQNNTGQTISTQKTYIVHRGKYYLGVKLDKRYVGKNESITARVKSVDTNGAEIPVSGVNLEIYKVKWDYFKRQEVDGGFYAKPEKKTELIQTFNLKTDKNGNSAQEFALNEEGEYEIIVSGNDKDGNTIKAFTSAYIYGNGSVSIKPTNNEQLELETEKTDVSVGDDVQFIIKSPYKKAKALVTVERGKIFDYKVVGVNSNLADYTFKIEDEYIPNVYATVLLLSSDPEIKYGQLHYKVNTLEREIDIEVNANKNVYLPGEEVELNIIAKDSLKKPVQAEISLAVVDVSVLALAGNKKKNPVVFFYSGMPLTVSTSSNIKNILYEVDVPQNSKGGGGGEPDDLAGKKRGDFRETAFWQGAVQTGGNGKAKISFTLPDNITSWQVESVGITKDTKLGVGYSEFMTQKQVMLTPLKPRFIIQGDEFLLGAKIFNQSGKSQTFDVSFESETLLLNQKNSNYSESLQSGETTTVYFNVIAPPNIQQGRHSFVLSAANDSHNDTVETSISITPNNTYEAVATANTTNNNTAQEFVFIPDNIIRGKGGITVQTSATLAVFMSDALKYLSQYPYGCSEQIASKLSAIAVLKRGLQLENVGDMFKIETIAFDGKEYSIDDVVKIGLSRLYENQQSDGGFSYYSNLKPNFHLTLHIVNALNELRDAGYEVNLDVINSAHTYLYNELLKKKKLMSDNDTVILTAYTLSTLEGIQKKDARIQTIKSLVDGILKQDKFINEDISNTSLAYLAIYLSRNNYSKSTKNDIFKILENRIKIDARGAFLDVKSNWMPLYYETPIKNTALLVKALAQEKRDNPLMDKFLRWLLQSRAKDGAWSSTNNTATVIDAFTSYLKWKGEHKSEFDLTLALDGKNINTFDFNNKTILNIYDSFVPVEDLPVNHLSTLRFDKENHNKEINNFYYDMSFKYYLPINSIPARDEGFAITRVLCKRDDEKCENPVSEAKAGEVLRGHLVITVPKTCNFVAVEDFVPAGVEIINTKLETEDKSLKTRSSQSLLPDAEELHDDRVFLFNEHLGPGVYEYDYYVRALIPGKFHHLPAVVSEMYFPENFGRTKGDYFTIHGQ